jgi:hypothetical protein
MYFFFQYPRTRQLHRAGNTREPAGMEQTRVTDQGISGVVCACVKPLCDPHTGDEDEKPCSKVETIQETKQVGWKKEKLPSRWTMFMSHVPFGGDLPSTACNTATDAGHQLC